MSFLKHSLVAAVVIVGTSVWAGCGSAGDDASSDDSAISSSGCNIFNNQSGKAVSAADLAKLNDPIANKILAGSDCPNSYSTILAKLKKTDSKGCSDKDGLQSFFVSEEAEFASSDAEAAQGGFRTVISKSCDGRKQDDMLFSSFASSDTTGETSIEMIGKDATTGVYNFYEVIKGNQWVFYGTSADFVGNGYDCSKSGFCKSLNSKKASSPSRKSCASCHISGALVMKELDSPWLHWTAGHQKGSEIVAKKFAEKLGNQDRGENLETNVVRAGFDQYSDRRVDILAAQGLQELVRPLFCTMDINLNSGLGGGNLMVDSELAFGSYTADQNTYDTLKKEVKQHIVGAPDKVDDTESGFTFPTRGQSDTAYSAALQRAKLVDAEFVSDVLSVDFTRTIFSQNRCALVDAVKGKTAAIDAKLLAYAKADKSKKPGLAADIAKDLPKVFSDAFKSSSKPAEKKLFTNLSDASQNAAQHQKDVAAFFDACNKRLGANGHDALKDIMTFAAHQRFVMRKDITGFNGQQLLEPDTDGDDKMPFDDIKDNSNALDPTSCELSLSISQVK